MNNINRNTYDLWAQYLNGTVQSSAYYLSRSNVFSFTGFGVGNHVDPTPGSFVHTVQERMKGNIWRTSLVAPFNKIFITGPEGGYSNYGQGIPHPDLDGTESNNLQNKALERLYKKMSTRNGAVSEGVDVSVDIGESRESVAMVRKAVKSASQVVTVAKEVGKRVFKQGKVVGELANAWLAYSYGWKPLLDDIHELAEFTSVYYKEFTFRGTATAVKEHHVVGVDTGWPTSIPIRTESKGFSSKRILYSVTCSVDDQTAFDLSRLTSLDPKRIAWELLPLSFVLDWFVDIGGYLQLQEAALGRGLTFKRGFQTISNLNFYKARVFGAGKSGTDLHQVDLQGSRRVTSKSRTKLNGFPRPAYPTLQVDLGWRRIITSGALLAQALGSPNHDIVHRAAAIPNWSRRNKRDYYTGWSGDKWS